MILACGAWPADTAAGVLLFVFLMNALAGAANFYTYVLTAKAMRTGPNGLVWGIMQAGMIGSTLMGILFFGEKAAWLRLSGLFLILGGVFVMGRSRDRKGAGSGKKWLLPAFGAFCLVAVTHCCSALPSFLPDAAKAGSAFRTFSMYAGGVFGFAVSALPPAIRAKRIRCGRGEWIAAASLMILSVVANFCFFFNGLDRLAEAGRGGLGYPVGIGVCVAGFSLYSLLFLKEKIARASLAGLGAVCIGIIAITIR